MIYDIYIAQKFKKIWYDLSKFLFFSMIKKQHFHPGCIDLSYPMYKGAHSVCDLQTDHIASMDYCTDLSFRKHYK